MTRGTTPTITVKIGGTNLADYSDLELTFKQGSTMLVKKLSTGAIEVAGDTIKVRLSQAETLAFSPDTVKIQLRAITPEGMVVSSAIAMKAMKDILNESVME